jgi:DeoR/GlpR family transcriptional regulator of sugar metabolism
MPPESRDTRTHATSKGLMTNQRRARISERVQNNGMARVSELASIFGVSEVTIRNDLVSLEAEGRLVRDHGGALSRDGSIFLTTLSRLDERAAHNLEAKRKIARRALQRVVAGETVLIDAGTTALEFARLVKRMSDLTLVTNALNVATELRTSVSRNRLIILGGTLGQESDSMLGSMTEHGLQELVVQKLFLGTQAMDSEHGLSDSTMEIARVKRAMINAAREVILITDSSKWGRSGFSKVAPLSDLDVVITDAGLPAAARQSLIEAGVEVVIA